MLLCTRVHGGNVTNTKHINIYYLRLKYHVLVSSVLSTPVTYI